MDTKASTDQLYTRINAFIKKHNLIIPGSTIILGLSGGPDSIFLLNFLSPLDHQGTIKLVAAHLDHQWRTESSQDVDFCRTACENAKIPFVTSTIEELGLSFKFNGSHEELGRKARRAFFKRLAQDYSTSTIALAHHRDDQLETFFIRLLRGASLTGLTGIKAFSNGYIRPLLTISKAEILEHLHTHNISFLTDPTNTSDHYLRNRIRGTLIPALHACDSRYTTTMIRTIEQLQQTEKLLSDITNSMYKELRCLECPGHTLRLGKFFQLNPSMQQRILLVWLCTAQVPFTPSQALFKEIIRFFSATKSNSHSLYPNWRFIKKSCCVTIATGC